MTSDVYSYTPLKDREIRLIRFSEGGDGVVPCELAAFSLDSKDDLPNYAALSYRWGTPKRDRSIYCHDKQLLITESLESFIHQVLRCQDKAERWAYGWFWIDAVCINQDDVSERSEQVRLMKAIYEGSSRITIWLGEGEDGVEEAFELCEQVSDFVDREGIRLRDGSMPGTTCLIGTEEFFVEALYSTLTFDLSSILQSPYWGRTWIIQEASTPNFMTSQETSGCNTLVHCGAHTIPFSKLMDANKALIAAAYNNDVPHLAQLHGIVNEDIATLWYIQYQRRKNLRAESIYKLMVRSRTYAATDMKDKVYSVLALSRESEEELLRPNYALSVEEVYTRLAKAVIIRSHSLDCLGSADLLRNSDVPSWVPDWTVQHGSIPQPFYQYDVYNPRPEAAKPDGTIHDQTNRLFNTDNNLPLQVRFSHSDQYLHVQGIVFDTIAHVSLPRHYNPTGFEPELPSKEVWQNWISLAKPDNTPYQNGTDTRFQAFTKLLKTECTTIFSDWSAIRWPTTWSSAAPASAPETLPFTIDRFTDPNVNAFELNDSILNAMTWGRRLFVTEQGYLGLGASSVEAKDCVCILFGSQMPVVLRRVEEKGGCWWEMVGQAFVGGIMDGGAVNITEGSREVVEFEIR